MNLPPYTQGQGNAEEDRYHQELNQTLLDGVSDNGFVIPSVTNQQLTVDLILNLNTLTSATLADSMPDGTLWLVVDSSPPIPVIKINGALYKLTVATYP